MFSVLSVQCGCRSNDYWPRIKELSARGTHQENPELEAYLKGLTQPEMIIAARECCSEIERVIPEERWPEASMNVLLALCYYGGHNALTSKTLKRESDYDALLAIVADKKEGRFFRQSLAMISSRNARSIGRYERLFQCVAEILADREEHTQIHALGTRALSEALDGFVERAIQGDEQFRAHVKAARKARDSWTMQDLEGVHVLVRKGQLALTEQTRDTLANYQEVFARMRTALIAMLEARTISAEASKGAMELKGKLEEVLTSISAILVADSGTASQKVAALLDKLRQAQGDDKAQQAAIKEAALEKSDDVNKALLTEIRTAVGVDEENILKIIYLSLGDFGDTRISGALCREEDPVVKARMIRMAAHFKSATSLSAILDQLQDKRAAERKGALMEGTPRRVCDVAYNSALPVLHPIAGQAFEETWPSTAISARDKHLSELEAFWKTGREALLAKLKSTPEKRANP